MNEEHFLTELKIHLRPLPQQEIQLILDEYQQKFLQGKTKGLTDVEVSKELGNPKEIAQEILEERHITVVKSPLQKDGWVEFTDEKLDYEQDSNYYDSEIPYDEHQQVIRPSSTFGRIASVLGLIFLNLFMMLPILMVVIILFAVAWIVVVSFFIAPFLGIIALVTSISLFGLMQIFIGLIFFGIALISIFPLKSITVFTWKRIKDYFHWNKNVLRGNYR